jgi:hypothetical protein
MNRGDHLEVSAAGASSLLLKMAARRKAEQTSDSAASRAVEATAARNSASNCSCLALALLFHSQNLFTLSVITDFQSVFSPLEPGCHRLLTILPKIELTDARAYA